MAFRVRLLIARISTKTIELTRIRSISALSSGRTEVVNSELLASFELSDAYLSTLRELLSKHKYRPVFGNCLVETLTAYNTKQLNKKCTLARQYALVKMVKGLFYLKTSEIVSFMDKVQCYLGGMETLRFASDRRSSLIR